MATQLPPNLLGVKVQLLISETEAFDGTPLEWMSMSESDYTSSSDSESEISNYSDESINVPEDQILYASKGNGLHIFSLLQKSEFTRRVNRRPQFGLKPQHLSGDSLRQDREGSKNDSEITSRGLLMI